MARDTLVSTEELGAHLADVSWVVIDCRHELSNPALGAGEYAESHIPGARFFHLDRDLAAPATGRNGRHPLPDPQAFMQKLGAAGVDSGKQVIAYDARTGVYAARLWWMLRWLGHDKVAVLDGGYAKWIAEGRPVTKDLPQPVPARFTGRPCPVAVDADEVLKSIGRPGHLLIDARAPDRFRGENETLDPVGGRIRGSHNRFFRDNLDADACFRPAAELRQAFSALLGDTPADAVVHSCGSGVSACHNLLAMEIAGLPGSRLYPGSWSEWSSDPRRPTETG